MDLIEAATLLSALHKSLSYQQNRLGAGKAWLLKIHQGSAFISQKFWPGAETNSGLATLRPVNPINSGWWVAGKMGRGRSPAIIWVSLERNTTNIQHADRVHPWEGSRPPIPRDLLPYKEIDTLQGSQRAKRHRLSLPVHVSQESKSKGAGYLS